MIPTLISIIVIIAFLILAIVFIKLWHDESNKNKSCNQKAQQDSECDKKLLKGLFDYMSAVICIPAVHDSTLNDKTTALSSCIYDGIAYTPCQIADSVNNSGSNGSDECKKLLASIGDIATKCTIKVGCVANPTAMSDF